MDGIFLGVDCHLVKGRGSEVNVELVRQADEIQEDVRKFVADPRAGLIRKCGGFEVRKPLEVFEELRDLDAKRDCQVLRKMELIPVAFSCELAQCVPQFR